MGAGCSSSRSVEGASPPAAGEVKRAESNATPALAEKEPKQLESTQSSAEASSAPAAPAAVDIKPTGARSLTILHFNDIYNIEPRTAEPVGGAARLAYKVKDYRARGSKPLVCFSGDAYNPSLMSTITLGKQMVAVMNELGVDVSCVGNHDFDYGLENLKRLNAQCNFPWLMANVVKRGTDNPYGGADKVWLQDWNGIKVGIVGLVEEEWLATLGAVDPSDMEYKDFIEVGRQLCKELKEEGAELLIALTHMREANDRKLAEMMPEFHIVLGGHDHHYVSDFIQPHNNLLVKSGTDFRDLSVLEVEFAPGATEPKMSVERIPIDSSIPEEPAMKAIVDENLKIMGDKMGEEIGETLEPLDGRFQTVRNRESNLGNFITDVWRKAARADMVITNGGSLRSDMIHPAGALTVKDIVSVLPYIVGTLVLECTGAQVVAALENGVSQWPKLEGRFPQVSGLKFKFDPSKPPGQRVVPGSVFATEMGPDPVPVEDERKYRVAVTEYLAAGKDGFDVLASCKVLVDDEAGVAVPTTIRNHFMQLHVLNKLGGSRMQLPSMASKWMKRTLSQRTDSKSCEAAQEDTAAQGKPNAADDRSKNHGLAVKHPERGVLCIAPVVEGRIVNIQEEAQPAQAATAQ